jgi:hypothetical protein
LRRKKEREEGRIEKRRKEEIQKNPIAQPELNSTRETISDNELK